MAVIEYLYVDKRRLDSYFEQISKTPVAYDKVPNWKAGLSISTLGVEASQTRVARPFTTHEKIQTLRQYFNKVEENTDFKFVSGTARKAVIPGTCKSLPEFKGLVLWYMRADVDPYHYYGDLYLLQDYEGDDEASVRTQFSMFTKYKMLEYLVSEALPSGARLLASADQYMKPRGYRLSELGAIISDDRPISSLFRIRYVNQGNWLSTYGYPIYIANGKAEDD